MSPERVGAFSNGVTLCGHQPRVAKSRQIFGRVEAECGGFAQRAGHSGRLTEGGPGGAESLGRVLDELQPWRVPLQGPERVHIHALAVEVDGQNSGYIARAALSEDLGHGVGGEVECPGINVGE